MKLKCLLISILVTFSRIVYGQDTELSDEEVLQYGFTFPISTSFPLKINEITSLPDLKAQINDFFIPSDQYFNAYKTLTVDSARRELHNNFYVKYTIGGRTLKSYSLIKPILNQEEKFKTATVIIPGSGDNQGTEIYYGTGYHGSIANEAALFSDVYIAIKPNQDFMALHRNGGRLNNDFLLNYMLNNGGSYSVSYIVNTLATVKYLKTVYDRVFVVGLSQGGLAALYNSLQSSPDATVIASGFTITRDIFEWAGHNQIIIPNSVNKISNEIIFETIKKQSTNYFFSWGKNEIGSYKLEAENKYTCNYFSDLTNVECNYHNQGHTFPQPFTNDFLWKIPFVRIEKSLIQSKCGQDSYLKPVSVSSHTIKEYKWYRNDTLLKVFNHYNDSLMLLNGGKYKLVVVTNEGKIFGSNEISISPVHSDRKLQLAKRFVIAPKGFNSYKWYINGKLIEHETGNEISIRQAGSYQCCLTDDLGSSSSDELLIDADYAFFVKEFEATIYPNPNNGQFKLELVSPERKLEKMNIIIYNILGQIVYENSISPIKKIEEVNVNIRDMPKGKYILKAFTPTKAFVKSVLIL